MAIAANFRKYAEAMALQLVLPFGRPIWNTSRPTTRLGREIRSFITKAMKARGLVEYPAVPAVPQWWKDAQTRARAFVKFAKEGQLTLSLSKPKPTISRSEYERANNYRKNVLRSQAERGEIVIA